MTYDDSTRSTFQKPSKAFPVNFREEIVSMQEYNTDLQRSAAKALAEISERTSTRDALARDAQLAVIEGTADRVCARLWAIVEAYEKSLDPAEEVGVRLVNFGAEVVFSVEELSWFNPSLIVFSGRRNGSPVQLVQHVNQLSFLLTAIPRKDPSKPRKPIGFGAMSANVASSGAEPPV